MLKIKSEELAKGMTVRLEIPNSLHLPQIFTPAITHKPVWDRERALVGHE